MVFADRVKETSTTTGTGAMSLGGAEAGFITFSSVMTNGQQCYYCIYGQTSTSWETGIGTYNTSGDTLSRTTVLASSNSGMAVNFGAETKDVFLSVDATYFSGTLSQNTTGTAANVTGTVAIANGGTGQVTAAAAITALAGTQASGEYLRSNGTVTALSTIQAIDVPTLNQSTTGTAGNVTGTVAIANGGTGQTSQQAALTALSGTQSSGEYLRSNGTNTLLSTIQAADVPTLNQSTTGTAAGLSGTPALPNGTTATTQTTSDNSTKLATDAFVQSAIAAGTAANVSGTVAIANGGTSATTALGALDALGAETIFNGIENAALWALSYSAANRQLTITLSTGAAYTVGGVRYPLSAGTVTTTAHANTTGLWFFYYDGTNSGALTVSSSSWNLITTAPIALVYYNATNVAAILFNELHPGVKGMGPAAHLNLHTTRGTQLLSGGVPSGYTLATTGLANTSYAISAGSIADEDLILSTTAQAQGGANTYQIMYQTGTSASPVWNWVEDAEGGIYTNGTNPYYNQLTGGSWQLTAITANATYYNYWVMAVPAYSAPQFIIIMGSATYTTLAAAEAATFATEVPNISQFTAEGIVLYQMTYERNNGDGAPGNSTLQAVSKVTASLISVGGNSGTVSSVGLTDSTGTFTISNSPITSSGNITLGPYNSQAQNAFLAAPATGGAGAPSFRSIVAADIPTLNQNTTGTAAGLSSVLVVAEGGTGVTTSTGTGSVVLNTSPTLVTPALGTPASGNLANCTFPTLNQNTTGTAAGLSATLSPASGGTGVANNSASTITVSGNYGLTQTLTGATNVTYPTSGTLATTAEINTALPSATSTQVYVGTGAAGVAAASSAPTISAANMTSFPTFNQNTTGSAASLSATLSPASGGTGVANNAAATVTSSGNFAYTRTLTGATNVTYPTGGTLATTTNINTALPSGTSSQVYVGTGVAGVAAASSAPAIQATNMTSFPTFNQNTTGTAANITATSNTTLTSISTLATVGIVTSGTWSSTIADYKETQYAAGTITTTWSPAIANGNIQLATMTSADNPTITVPSLATGQSLTLILVQPASGTLITAVTFSGQTFSNMASSMTPAATLGFSTYYTIYNNGARYEIFCVPRSS
jgi:hypothetical protein